MRETVGVSSVIGSGQANMTVALTSTSDASGPWETDRLDKLSFNQRRLNVFTTR